MKKIFPVFTILVVIFTMSAQQLMSQSYKLHAEYRTDWYGAGYDMLQDIPGYPSVILQAELSANQYVIESDNDANKWRQFGTTTYNQASLFLWYNSPVSDNELADSTTQNKWYTTRIKDAGYTSTEGIVMETTNEPAQFAAVNTIVQTTPNPVYTNQNINFTVNMAGPRSPEEFCFMRYSYDNFVTSDIVIVFFSGLNDLTGNATISATATEKTVQVYAFTSTYDAWNFPASDFDLITLRRGLNNGNTVSVTTFDPPSASTVRFRVDMKNVTPGPNGPHVVGSFNNWDSTATPMTQGVGSLWFADVVVDTNDILQYRFLGDDTYAAQETVPNACGVDDGFGVYNRKLNVPNVANTTLPVVCFSSCAACVYPDTVLVTFRVDVGGPAPNGVSVFGSWDNYAGTALGLIGGTTWGAAIKLDTTTQVLYYYKKGTLAENFYGNCTKPNGLGGNYRFLNVPEANTVLNIVCFNNCQNCANNNKVTVTFRVDMTGTPLGPGNAHVVGNFNNFNPFATLFYPKGNGIYEATALIDTTQVIYYKFLRDASFTGEEKVPAACGVFYGAWGDTLRKLTIPENDTLLDVVCYSSCIACQPTSLVEITFRVDMNIVPVGPGGVHMAGNFNGWNTTQIPMTQEGSTTIYRCVLKLDTAIRIKFTYFSDTTLASHENIPSNCGHGGNGQNFQGREYDVDQVSTVLLPVCFGYCSCNNVGKVKVRFRVDMANTTIGNSYAHIVGTFNNFDPTATIIFPVNGTIYIQDVLLDTNTTYQYKFLRDANFIGAEVVPSACGVPDGNGGYLREVYIGYQDTMIKAVCYGGCSGACPPNSQKEITFKVDMSNTTFGPGGPHVIGNFNNYDVTATPMIDGGNGLYYAAVFVDTSQTIIYKFLKDSSLVDQEQVPVACDDANDFRQVYMGNTGQIVPTVCYGSCTTCKQGQTADVTFRVDVGQSGFGSGVYLATSDNGFNPLQMNSLGGSVYSLTLNLDTTLSLDYYFINNLGPGGDEIVPSACGVLNGFGNYYRHLEVPESPLLLPNVCFGECVLCPPPPLSDVTFQVNVSNTNIGANAMYLAGDFNSWNTTSLLMTNYGNGIWKRTVTLDTTKTIQYRFFVGNTFAGSETVNVVCGITDTVGGLSRQLEVPEADVILPAVCLNECVNCPSNVNVTFRCNFAQTTIGAGKPHLAGTFNGWSLTATPMDSIGNSIYEKTLTLDSTLTYEYKFLSDTLTTAYEIVPNACGINNGGVYNRKLIAPEVTTVLPAVCYASCNPCVFPDSVDITFKVDLSLVTLGNGGPHLVGSFNNWNANKNPLSQITGNIWGTTLRLDTTEVIEYKFTTDNNIASQELVPVLCGTPNVFYGLVRKLIVPQVDSTLTTVCFSSCVACPLPVTANVRFRVNMLQTTIGAGKPHLAGTFNGWSNTLTPLDSIGNGIYEVTLQLDTTSTIQYKFLNDTTFNTVETVPVLCGVPDGFGGFNRSLAIPESDILLPTVCYSACTDCIFPDSVDVTFQVDLAQVTLGPGGPHLVGNFNGFDVKATPLANVTGTIYAATLRLDTMLNAEYKFLVDTSYINEEIVPQACGISNGFGGYNRLTFVPENDTVLPVVCYSSCAACVVPDSVDVTFQVDLAQVTLGQGGPHLVGSFNSFDVKATPLANVTGTIYAATVRIDTTANVEYKFLVDTSYINEETVPQACGVPNGFGGYNRFLSVPENDTVLSVVCYSGCSACVVPDSVDVTFQVDLAQVTLGQGGPHLVGTFNGFDVKATPLANVTGTIYAATVRIDTTSNVEYKFLVDTSYINEETVPQACGVPNGFGGYNRFLSVPENDTVLDVVCYSACAGCVLPDSVLVTFQVDMAQVSFGTGGPHIVGTFNNWDVTATPLTFIGGTIYGKTILLDTTDNVEYKFLVDSSYINEENVPQACGVPNGFGGYNRFLSVPENDTILKEVCYSACAPCVPFGLVNVTFRVDMKNAPLGPGGPHLVGAFNNWNPTATPLNNLGNNIYGITLPLDTTKVYSYRFLSENSYNNTEVVPAICGIADSLGVFNRFIDVPEFSTILPIVCYSECGPCTPTANVLITFQVDLAQVTPVSPHLVGSFNGWNATATPMWNFGGTVWGVQLPLDSTLIYEYKFLVDSSYANEETVPAACGVPNGLGGFNRQVIVPEASTILPLVCYSSCIGCVNNNVNVTFKVDMHGLQILSYNPIGLGGVHIVGSFNGWNTTATPMTDVNNDSIFEVTIPLDSTTTVQYKFLRDTNYTQSDPVPALCGVPDGFGGYNRQLQIPEFDITLQEVCYGFCSGCFVGVQDLSSSNWVAVYPNPVDEILTIELDMNNSGNTNILLFDAKGALVKNVNAASAINRLDVSALDPGIYLLQVISENGIVNKKITVR